MFFGCLINKYIAAENIQQIIWGYLQINFYNFVLLQMGRKQPSENLDKAIDHMYRKTKDLRRQLRKAVVDHVSDRYDAKDTSEICYYIPISLLK